MQTEIVNWYTHTLSLSLSSFVCAFLSTACHLFFSVEFQPEYTRYIRQKYVIVIVEENAQT